MQATLLEGPRLRLTAFDEPDLPVLVRWHQDTTFLRFYDSLPAIPKSATAIRHWFEGLQGSTTIVTFAVRLRESGELVGVVELDGIDWKNGTAGFSIGIGDRAFRGHGYGEEATRLMLDFAFAELNLHRIQLTVFSYNERAIGLYEKLGFQHEGTARERIWRDGQRYHLHYYGLLRPEWEARTQGQHD